MSSDKKNTSGQNSNPTQQEAKQKAELEAVQKQALLELEQISQQDRNQQKIERQQRELDETLAEKAEKDKEEKQEKSAFEFGDFKGPLAGEINIGEKNINDTFSEVAEAINDKIKKEDKEKPKEKNSEQKETKKEKDANKKKVPRTKLGKANILKFIKKTQIDSKAGKVTTPHTPALARGQNQDKQAQR